MVNWNNKKNTIQIISKYTTIAFQFVFADCTEADLNSEYLKDGLYFEYNSDIDGAPLLVVRSYLHIRGLRDENDLARICVYFVERLMR